MKLLVTKLRHYTFILSEFIKLQKIIMSRGLLHSFYVLNVPDTKLLECTDDHYSAPSPSCPQNYFYKYAMKMLSE